MIFKKKQFSDCYENIAHTIYENIASIDKIVIFIIGPMGAGKTTLCRDLLLFFGATQINSASFGIINKITGGDREIVHCDFYRHLPNDEFIEVEILPLLQGKFILVIEWGSPQIMLHEAQHFTLDLTILDNGDREINFQEL